MILTRYIGKDILTSTVAITFILLLVIVSGRFVGYMADAAAGELPAELLQYLLVYTMPGLFQLVLPLGFFIAVMLVYGQLYVDTAAAIARLRPRRRRQHARVVGFDSPNRVRPR